MDQYPVEDPLAVTAEQMRRTGYEVVDWLVEHALALPDEPVLLQASPAEMRQRVEPSAPLHGADLDEVLAHLAEKVLPYRSRIDHPRYLAYIPGQATWPGVLGDLVASAYNIDAGNWMESSGPSQLETTVLRWFADWIGYPADAAGVLVSGGSAANLTALACAREGMAGAMREDLVLYVSEQGHSSLARAARVLGFGARQVRVLPVDRRGRMRVDALGAAIEADLGAGLRPLAVLAVAGTTNTGAVDDLPALAQLCRRYGVWLHVDAAYGAFAVLTERGRAALTGLAEADSITLDPHKWLYQPFECGAVLVRRGHLLREAFEIHPSYLEDTRSRDGAVNYAEAGLQLTRMSRALKVWMSVQYFGVEAFAAAIDRALDGAAYAERWVRDSPELELLSPAALGIVCFRRHPAGLNDAEALERFNAALVAGLARSGVGLLSSTRLFGRYAVRLCVLNHGTGQDDIEQVLRWVATAEPDPTDLEVVPRATGTARAPADLTAGWPGVLAATPDELRSLPLLSRLEETLLRWVGAVARRRRVATGETIVRQWDVDRDFYLLLDGTATVVSGDRELRTLEPGDFFGELAALDWGASFGYPRLATVRARTDLVLLVLTDAELAELMARSPAVDRAVRSAAAERAARI